MLLLSTFFGFNNIVDVEAQTGDPIDAGITDLKAKVNATYARGDCYSVKYEDGVYKWQTEPMWVWSEAEGRYVPYILEDKFASEGYIQVQSGLIGARIYQSYAMFYDPNMTEVRLYQEQWEVQQWNPKTKKWVAVIGSYSTFEGYIINKDERCVNVTMMYSSWAGRLNVAYTFREGAPLKHTVVFKSALDYETDFRVIQKWAGIVAAKVKHDKGKNVITSAKTIDSPWFKFLKEDGSLSIFENQWSMYYGVNETTGEVYVKANECLKPVEIDVHAQGLKANFVFGNWTLARGESLTVDPDTATLSNPVEDGCIKHWYSGLYERVNTDSYIEVGGYLHPQDYFYVARGYVEWDVSSIPDNADVTKVVFKYDGYLRDIGSPDCHIHEMKGARPSTSSDPTVYSEAGEGTVYADPDGFPVADVDQVDLGSSAASDLELQLSSNWFAIGIQADAENTDSYSYIYAEEGGGQIDPTLYVEYVPNNPPNAPTLDSPADSARYDPSESVTFTWTFSDPDSGDTQSAYQLQIAYDSGFTSIFLDTGKVSSSSTSTTRTLPSDVGVYYWRVRTWDNYGAVGPYSSGRAIIVDRIKVDSLSADDTRLDVGATVTLTVQLVYEYDNTAITSGSFTLNGLTLTHQGSGTWTTTDLRPSVTAVTYNSVSGSVGNLNTVNMNGKSVTVIWDRVNVTLSLSNSRIDVGSTMQWSFTAVYEYDGQTATPYVTVSLNDTATKTSVGKWAFTVSSITESQYGLTAFTSNTVECIWDRVQITLSVSDTRIDVGSTMLWSFTATYEYDGSDAASYVAVTLNDTDTKSTVGKWAFTVSSITDSQYGLTAFTSNTIECIWDKVQIALSISDARIDVGSEMSWSYTATYSYDGADATPYITVTLNDTTTKTSVGKWAFTVSSITDTQYGLTVFESNTIECIWDRVNITAFSAVDNTIKVGEEAQFIIEGVYEYDNAVWSGTYSLNDTLSHSAIGKYGYRITSITDNNYGLTVFVQSAPDVYVLVGFNSLELYNTNEQFKLEDKPYIVNTTDIITSLTFSPTKLTFKVEEIPEGETSVTVVKGIDGKLPLNVYIDGSTVYLKSTKEDFDSYGGKCWYYDTTNDQIYVKTFGSLIEILWEGYSPPPTIPPGPPSIPTTPTYDVKIVDVPSMVCTLIEHEFIAKISVVNPTSIQTDVTLTWQLLDLQGHTIAYGQQVFYVPAFSNTTTTVKVPVPFMACGAYTFKTQITNPVITDPATQTIQFTPLPTKWLTIIIILAVIAIAAIILLKKRR